MKPHPVAGGDGQAILEESLDQRLNRHAVIVSNVTNSLTPGYRALAYDFETQLQAAAGAGDNIPMKATDPRHLRTSGMTAQGELQADLYVQPTESIGNDGNTVNIDQEMADLASNQLLYRATLEALNRKLAMLRYGISGGH